MADMQYKIGENYTIDSLQGEDVVVERLRELGCIPGEQFTVLHRAPFGEPIVIKVSETSVALRKLELKCIQTR